jgi:hypothetical protein
LDPGEARAPAAPLESSAASAATAGMVRKRAASLPGFFFTVIEKSFFCSARETREVLPEIAGAFPQ